jgi:transmembrane sensor
MKKLDAKELLDRYLSGNCTEEEQALLESWHLSRTARLHTDLSMDDRSQDLDEVWERLQLPEERPRRISLWPRIAAVAVLLLSLSAGIVFYLSKAPKNSDAEQMAIARTIVPVGNRAILTLDNGTQISLSDAKAGTLASQSGVDISKSKDGQLVYHLSNVNKPNSYNTITTPHGGQYQVVLPDGTRVWLNAGSSLRFPLTFDQLNERKVELKGEAYFEVAKQLKEEKGIQERVPFIVMTATQEVEVLGTHFNINAYADEPAVRTTLLEGRVKVFGQLNPKAGVLLKPGEQAVLKDKLSVAKVDTEEVMSWKNGFFRFNESDLKTIMRQASRWYNVDVVYEGNIPPIKFTGEVPRSVNAATFLEMLRYLNIKFKIEKQTNTRNKIVVSL